MRIKVRIGRARHAFKVPDEVPTAHGNYAVLERFALLKEEREKAYAPFVVGASVAFLKDVDGILSLVYGRISHVQSNGSGTYTGLEVYDRKGNKHVAPWGVSVTI